MVDKTPKPPTTKNIERLEKMQRQRKEIQGDLLAPLSESVTPPVAAKPPEKPASKPAAPKARRARKAPERDFFSPILYDVGARDNRGVMDVAPFRLSKSDKRANSVIRYELPDGHVQVSSGSFGMASVFDYDLVLMAVSHLTESMNQYRQGKGDMPGQTFRPHIGDVLKFCRKEDGGNQRQAVVGALERLSTTHVSIERSGSINGKPVTINEGENLIGPYRTISNGKSDKIEYVEFKVADWMYEEITQGTRPDVLTVHPDYFLSESGIVRFIYRLARKAAGKDMAAWGFALIFERSGSTGSLKEFSRALRKIIEANDVAEYSLAEEPGKRGPVLRMVHRSCIDQYMTPPVEE